MCTKLHNQHRNYCTQFHISDFIEGLKKSTNLHTRNQALQFHAFAFYRALEWDSFKYLKKKLRQNNWVLISQHHHHIEEL